MKTATAVIDGKLTDEQLGQLNRRTGEITRRLNEGTFSFNWAINQLQRIIEGKNTEERDWTTWTSLEVMKGKPDLGNLRIINSLRGIFEIQSFPWPLVETNYDLVYIDHNYWKQLCPCSFPGELSRSELYQYAQQLGLRLCPPALAISLYHFITKSDICSEMRKSVAWKINIGMEPVYAPALDELVVLDIESNLHNTGDYPIVVEMGLNIASMCRYASVYPWLFVRPPVSN